MITDSVPVHSAYDVIETQVTISGVTYVIPEAVAELLVSVIIERDALYEIFNNVQAGNC